MQYQTEEALAWLKSGKAIGVTIDVTCLDDQAFRITETDIVIGSLVLDRNSISGADIEIGNAETTQLSFALDNEDRRFDAYRLEGAILITQFEYGATILPVGKFTVDAPPKKLDTISVVSLDYMAKTNRVYVPLTGLKSSVRTLLLDAGAKCGVTVNLPVSFLNDTYLAVNPIEATTYHNVIAWCAEIAGANAWVDENGELRLSWYGENQTVSNVFVPIVLDGDTRYDYGADENDITITGITYTSASSEVKLIAGTEVYTIGIVSNPLIDPLDAQSVINSIYEKIGGFTYRPIEITVDGFPHLWAMDILTIVPTFGDEFQSIITNHSYTLNGNSIIKAQGTTATNAGYASAGIFTPSQKAALKAVVLLQSKYTLTDYEAAMMLATDALNASRGWYETKVLGEGGIILEYYQHDQPTLAASLKVTRVTAAGVGYSNDGGVTYETTISSTGASVPVLAARIIHAEMITISGASTYASGYDPSTKETPAGAQAKADAAYASAQSFANGIASGLQSQIDGSITTFFYAYVPTLENVPSSDWATTALKNQHLGDLFYDTSTGYSYRYQLVSTTYSWQRISDTDITTALANAATAQDTADHKRRVFVATPTTPYDIGDLWAGGSSGDLKKCSTARASGAYSNADWTLASKYTDDTTANTAITNAATAQSAADAAQGTANTAKAYTDNLASDSVITPDEKLTLKPKWDEIVAEGFPALTNLISDGTALWGAQGGTLAVVNGELEFTESTANSEHFVGSNQLTVPVTGHKYYFSGSNVSSSVGIFILYNIKSNGSYEVGVSNRGIGKQSGVFTCSSVNSNPSFFLRAYGIDGIYTGTGAKHYFDNISMYDLTDEFCNGIVGTGLEPTAAQVEAMQTSFNIFNKNTVTTGYYAEYYTGNLAVQPGFSVSDWIEVLPNTAYKATGVNQNYAQYDQNKTYITTALPSEAPFTFATAPNCKYVRLSIYTPDLDYVQCVLEWFDGTYAYGKIPAQALSFGVSDSTFDSAFANLHKYLINDLDMFTAMGTAKTGLVRATWDLTWNNYYGARTDLLNAISTKTKTLADTAQTSATNAATVADAKNKVFYTQPVPPYYIGDIWQKQQVPVAVTDIVKCTVTRLTGDYTAADWANAYTLAEIAAMGDSILVGGYFKTALIDVATLIAQMILTDTMVASILTNSSDTPECWATIGTLDDLSADGLFVFHRGSSATVPAFQLVTNSSGDIILTDKYGRTRMLFYAGAGGSGSSYFCDGLGFPRLGITAGGGIHLWSDFVGGVGDTLHLGAVTLPAGDVQEQINNISAPNTDTLLPLASIITITTIYGATIYAAGGGIYYYKIGPRVHVHVAVSGLTANTAVDLIALPASYRPYSTVVALCSAGVDAPTVARLVIVSNGTINVVSSGTYLLGDIEYDAYS